MATLPWLSGCLPATATPTAAPTADSDPGAGPGVAVDLPTVPPTARESATVDDHVVTLETPVGVESAMETVSSFFAAVLAEDAAAVARVVAHDAVVQDLPDSTGTSSPGGSKRSREALNFWAQRFRQRDYGKLAAELVYRPSEIQVFRTGLLDRVPAQLRSVAAEKLDTMGPSDLLLRVPIRTVAVRSEQLFGKEIYLWLRPHAEVFTIYHLAEPYPF